MRVLHDDASIVPWSGNPPAASIFTNSRLLLVRTGARVPTRCRLPRSLTSGSLNLAGWCVYAVYDDDVSRRRQPEPRRDPAKDASGTRWEAFRTSKLCGEAQANAGTCGPESLIGHTTVSVGLGGNPYTVTGGEVFITGPYEGAPYGLSIVNPAKAGPFDLGKVIVRATIEVDPITAALTITSDTTGPYAIPQFIDGIPLQIKHVNVTIDRPDFTFNPTNCSPMSIGGSLTSSAGRDLEHKSAVPGN